MDDPQRSMALLWRASGPAHGPGLTVDAIVATAVEIADADGMGAVSMRAVGRRLGRTAMALYGHVPGKAELVDLMCDQVLAALPTEYPADGWRAAVTAWATDLRSCYVRHPWLLAVPPARPARGPGEFAVLNTVAGLLRGTGLPRTVLRGVTGALLHFVRGAAAAIVEARRAGTSPVAAELAPDVATRFPTVRWLDGGHLSPAGGRTYPERTALANFALGLAVLLDGVDARL